MSRYDIIQLYLKFANSDCVSKIVKYDMQKTPFLEENGKNLENIHLIFILGIL